MITFEVQILIVPVNEPFYSLAKKMTLSGVPNVGDEIVTDVDGDNSQTIERITWGMSLPIIQLAPMNSGTSSEYVKHMCEEFGWEKM